MPNLNLDQVASNQNQKEVTINDAFAQVDEALTETLAVDLSAGDATLTADQWTRNWFFMLTGHTVARTLTMPATRRPAVVKNAGTGVVTLQVYGGGSAVVQPGQTVMVYNDGANVAVIGGGAPAFTNLTDTFASYAGKGGQLLRVKTDESGLESAAFDKVMVYLNTATNTTNAGWQKIPVDTVAYDTNSLWDAANKRIIPKRAGYYQVAVRIRTNTAGTSTVAVGVNGVQSLGASPDGNLNGNGGTGMVYCNGTTDYIELWAFAASVRALNIGTFDTYMSALGPF